MKCKFLLTGSNGVLSKSKSRRCVTYFCKSDKLLLSVQVNLKQLSSSHKTVTFVSIAQTMGLNESLKSSFNRIPTYNLLRLYYN